MIPLLLSLSLASATGPATGAHRDSTPELRVTILYDAMTSRSDLNPDWGFSALIRYHGKQILFDTGDNAAILARNAQRLGVGLHHLDMVVVSHRHSDHVSGLPWVLSQAPTVPVYAPREPFGIFGGILPTAFLRADTTLPASMRYFAGAIPATLPTGTLWPETRFTLVDSLLTVGPGITLVSTVSHTPGTMELREVSLVLETAQGVVVIVGCSHPGIETILGATAPLHRPILALFGGLHLVTTPDSAIASLAGRLHDQWRVIWMAPGHCTGEPAFAALKHAFGSSYLYAGLGTTLSLP